MQTALPDREGAIKKREACPEKSVHLEKGEKGSDHISLQLLAYSHSLLVSTSDFLSGLFKALLNTTF